MHGVDKFCWFTVIADYCVVTQEAVVDSFTVTTEVQAKI